MRLFHPLSFVVWGLLLSTLSLNIYGFHLVITLIGLFMYIVGSYQLKEMNRIFKTVYYLGWGRLIYTFVIVYLELLYLDWSFLDEPVLYYVLNGALFIVQMVLLSLAIQMFAVDVDIDYSPKYAILAIIFQLIVMAVIIDWEIRVLILLIVVVSLYLILFNKWFKQLEVVKSELEVEQKRVTRIALSYLIICMVSICYLSFEKKYTPIDASPYEKETITNIALLERLKKDIQDDYLIGLLTNSNLSYLDGYKEIQMKSEQVDLGDIELSVKLVQFQLDDENSILLFYYRSPEGKLNFGDRLDIVYHTSQENGVVKNEFYYEKDKQLYKIRNTSYVINDIYYFTKSMRILNYPIGSTNHSGMMLIESKIQFEDPFIEMKIERKPRFIEFPFKNPENVNIFYINTLRSKGPRLYL